MNATTPGQVIDPVKLASMLWPGVVFYRQQREIIYSVVENYETVVVAGNMLGKDFVTAFIVLWFFLTRQPCRIVTTSADFGQLEAVLWGELRRFIQTSEMPLSAEKGGPLVINHMHLRRVLPANAGKVYEKGELRRMGSRRVGAVPTLLRERVAEGTYLYDGWSKVTCGLSYCVGRVAAKGEGMLGHHIADVGDGIPRTLFVADEASGVDDVSFERSETWAQRRLIIGNPYPTQNHFYRAVKAGNILAE